MGTSRNGGVRPRACGEDPEAGRAEAERPRAAYTDDVLDRLVRGAETERRWVTETMLCSPSKEVVLGFERPFVVIGERINPTGRKHSRPRWRQATSTR